MKNKDLRYECYKTYLEALRNKSQALSYLDFCKLLFDENKHNDT